MNASIRKTSLRPRGLDDRHGLGVVHGERLLAEDVLAGFGGFDGPLGVHRMRRGDVDRLHVRVGEQRFVAAVAAGTLNSSPNLSADP